MSRKRFSQGISTEKLAFRRQKSTFKRIKLQDRVCAFFKRDDVSCLTAGRSQTINNLQTINNKQKKQKRFLNDHIRLHKRFLLENPSSSICYSLFRCMHPFWVVTPTNADRETCLCKVHENLAFLVEKLYLLKVVASNSLDSIVESTCCSIDTKGCMYGECNA